MHPTDFWLLETVATFQVFWWWLQERYGEAVRTMSREVNDDRMGQHLIASSGWDTKGCDQSFVKTRWSVIATRNQTWMFAVRSNIATTSKKKNRKYSTVWQRERILLNVTAIRSWYSQLVHARNASDCAHELSESQCLLLEDVVIEGMRHNILFESRSAVWMRTRWKSRFLIARRQDRQPGSKLWV